MGAATKRHPDVPLDFVIDYGEPMTKSGYYFMDSPGNDLESIAGQVAAGCNLIFFVTGNGSITNFPFVPTIKVVTTTDRYNLLSDDMDVNAGQYLDGKPLTDLGHETFEYMLDIASGQLSIGEKTGHSQVQIWRDWYLTESIALDTFDNIVYAGVPIPVAQTDDVPTVEINMQQTDSGITSQQIGLILPTSLCSGQIAKLCVNQLNQHPMLAQSNISHFVTLTHTEGCGSSINDEFQNTLIGCLGHPFVRHALLLEHGCEATHNDYFRHAMQAKGFSPENYGWASIQLDGGIQAVIQKIATWFEDAIDNEQSSHSILTDLSHVRLAIISDGEQSPHHAQTIATLTQWIVQAGGIVLIGERDKLLLHPDFVNQLNIENTSPSIGYADIVTQQGFHIMAMPTRNRSEILTGLGTTVDVIISLSDLPLAGHPMIPMLQVSDFTTGSADVMWGQDAPNKLLNTLIETLSQRYIPSTTRTGNVNFQITRGMLGVSL